MKRLAALAMSVLLAACASSQPPDSGPGVQASSGTSSARVRFVILGDRTGGHRPGVFGRAMHKVELLQPDFVMTVGDLIEGYTDDEAEIERQWDEFEARLSVLSAPVFHVAGNHDVFSEASARIWRERRGAAYWSRVQDGVLILGLSTEDPPKPLSAETMASSRQLEDAMAKDAERTQRRILDSVKARGAPPQLPGSVNISDAQVSFVERALEANPDVEWTFVVMHKPAWLYDSENFARIEALLAGRPYTAIAGHEHYYEHETRRGRDYIVMGTTGGVWLRDGPGRVDHVMMVTLTDKGPVMANLRVDGIFPKAGQSTPTSIPDGGADSSAH